MRPEQELLVLLVRNELTEVERERCRACLARGGLEFDWASFLEQAVRHHVAALVARNLDALGLHLVRDGDVTIMPEYHWELLQMVLEQNRRQNLLYAEAITEMVAAVGGAARFQVRKGIPLGLMAYGSTEVRISGDVDVVTDTTGARIVVDALQGLGYSPWAPNPVARRLNFLAGTVARLHRGCDIWPRRVEIEIATAVTPPTLAYDFPSGQLLDSTRYIDLDGASIPVAGVEEFMVDICMHFFEDAKSISSIALRKDLTLQKFCDVAMYAAYLSTHGSWSRFVELAVSVDLQAPLGFVLHTVAGVYSRAFPASVLAQVPACDLNVYGEIERTRHEWADSGGVDRLFRLDRPIEARRATALLEHYFHHLEAQVPAVDWASPDAGRGY